MRVSLFRCGRCGKRYTNPFSHLCITRLDSKRKPRRTKAQAKVTFTCGRCGKTHTNPLGHTCTVKTDFAKRKRAQARQTRTGGKNGKTTTPRQGNGRSAARGKGRGGGAAHDYRECFYTSQPDTHRPASDCPAFGCRVYREGHEHGQADGYLAGHTDGYAEGYHAGYAEGYAAAAQSG